LRSCEILLPLIEVQVRNNVYDAGEYNNDVYGEEYMCIIKREEVDGVMRDGRGFMSEGEKRGGPLFSQQSLAQYSNTIRG
jgi:hypothetical protein